MNNSMTIVRDFRIMDTTLKVPESGKFFRILHDAELFGFPRQKETTYPNREIPATRQLWGARDLNDFFKFDASWQWCLFELFRMVVGPIPADGLIDYWWYENPLRHGERVVCSAGTINAFPQYETGSLRSAYMSFIEDHRAFTDNHAFNTGFGNNRDYVIPLNTAASRPWEFKSLTTTGNIVRMLEPQPAGIASNMMAIETFDFTKPAPSLAWILSNKPYLIWWATEQGGMDRELPMSIDGKRKWVVARFPQLKIVCRRYGIEEVGTPYFAPGRGYNLIEKTHVTPIENGVSFTPYVS